MSDNPYEPPRQAEPLVSTVDVYAKRRWMFFFILALTACGVFSFAPWLAILFFALSAPLFFRLWLLRADQPRQTVPVASRAAAVLGSIGLAISILAASAGTFFGTCTATSYVVGLPLVVRAGARRQSGLAEEEFAIRVGVVVGVIAGTICCAWLAYFFHHAGRKNK